MAHLPDEISCGEAIFDIDFHPKANVLATGLVDGSVEIWCYNTDSSTMYHKSNYHTESCRGVLFNESGTLLYTISKDRSLHALDTTGKEVLHFPTAHDEPINKILNINENILATGDDEGVVKLWDIRQGETEVMSWHKHEDFVSGFAYNEEQQTLLSVGGDKMLCAYDLRNQNNSTLSDDQESELTCVTIIKGGRKVLCGTQDGVMLIFSWGRWGDCSDRYPGKPPQTEPIDCMLNVDNSTVLTGSSDGLIRCNSVFPNKQLGIIGEGDLPIEVYTLLYPYISFYTLIYPYIPVYTRIYPYIPLYTRIYPYIPVYTLIYPYITVVPKRPCQYIQHIRRYNQIRKFLFLYRPSFPSLTIHSFYHTLIHPYTHTPIHSYTHTLIHSYTHTLIHTYIHTLRA